MFIVQEFDDDGAVIGTWGAGTREQAVKNVLHLADEHGYLPNDDEIKLLEDGYDQLSCDDGWSWEIVEITPFPV